MLSVVGSLRTGLCVCGHMLNEPAPRRSTQNVTLKVDDKAHLLMKARRDVLVTHLTVVASKKIKPNSELFWKYGQKYRRLYETS